RAVGGDAAAEAAVVENAAVGELGGLGGERRWEERGVGAGAGVGLAGDALGGRLAAGEGEEDGEQGGAVAHESISNDRITSARGSSGHGSGACCVSRNTPAQRGCAAMKMLTFSGSLSNAAITSPSLRRSGATARLKS